MNGTNYGSSPLPVAAWSGRLLLLLVLLASALPAWSQAKIGQPAPEFAVKDINGRTHKLGDYRGKVVVLEAFNPTCPFCLNHYKTGAMPGLQGATVNKGVVWLVVNSLPAGNPGHRAPEAAQKDFASLGMKASALIDDSSGALAKLYGMTTTPQVFVINAQGVLAYQGAVDDRADSKADPRTAKSYVRSAIESLLTNRPVPTAETKPYGTPLK